MVYRSDGESGLDRRVHTIHPKRVDEGLESVDKIRVKIMNPRTNLVDESDREFLPQSILQTDKDRLQFRSDVIP